MMATFPVTDRNRVRRYAKRARYDKATIYAVLDEALVCYVAFVQDGRPRMVPTLFVRRGDALLFHGSAESSLMRHIAAGGEVVVSAVLVDGLVVTKAITGLSVNYRSVMVFGHGRLLEGEEAKREAMRLFADRLVPGHWTAANAPASDDLQGVTVAEVAIESASAKVNAHLPDDAPEFRDLPVWAGYIPVGVVFGEPHTADYADDMEMPPPLREAIARLSSPHRLPKE